MDYAEALKWAVICLIGLAVLWQFGPTIFIIAVVAFFALGFLIWLLVAFTIAFVVICLVVIALLGGSIIYGSLYGGRT